MYRINNVLSLFDGISCGQIALERCGINYDNYFSSEIDKHAIKVTEKNYPNTKQLGNIKDIKCIDLPNIDLLIGGSSCQNFSFAGNKKGMSTIDNVDIINLEQYLELKKRNFNFQGESYLFWEYIRIFREIKPKYFLLENVKMSKKWESIITSAIGVNPIKFDSATVSAQTRKRLYWTNIPNIKKITDKKILIKDIFINDVENRVYVDKNRIKNEWWTKNYYQYDLSGKKHKSQDQRAYFMNGKHGTLPSRGASSKTKVILKNGDIVHLTPVECERLQTIPDNYTDCISDSQRYKMIGNGWTIDVISHIFKEMLIK